ncbi:MAG: type secretory pathway, VirD4 component [Chitinophagaceae bacterium]|nr:type secretory pathway, VirD4 component [Chitinophagaceae bacterium]
MQTGENEQGLRKILDLTRMISISVLLIHFYYCCYAAFNEWQLRSEITDRLLQNIFNTGMFSSFNKSKLIALLFLIISLIGAKGKKNDKLNYKTSFAYIITGLLLYFISYVTLYFHLNIKALATTYISVTVIGFILVLTGGTLLSRIISQKLNKSVFNSINETFPQEERLLNNEYSINLPARYNLKGKLRKSWINIINPFRGLLIMGSPGSGKSYFIIQHIIKQHIQKGFSMFVYDFKFDDLSQITYNQFLKNKHRYKIEPKFYVINFDDLSRSHRCNPLAVSTMHDITDAAESSRTIMLGLNQQWIKKGGDFFVESPINFVTALIWFLRNYKDGKYCTLPHVIELAQIEYDKLFSILRAEPQIDVLINPFVTAYLNNANEQLEGQIASAKLSLAKLASPPLYYILSGNDFSLDINNPKQPKIVCMGNNPQKTQTYGAVLSLYITAIIRLMNKKGCDKSSLVFDEFPTIYFNGMDNLIATARSNKVATTLAVQDASQLKLHYGKEQAEVILNIVGNIISGQVSGETAKQLSEKFGKILQDRQSINVNRNDTSVTNSKQLELAIPINKISSLSSGEFVGMVADNPDQKIKLKAFCSEVINDHESLDREQSSYKELPACSSVKANDIFDTYLAVKKDIVNIVQTEIERMLDTPGLTELLIKKESP